MTDSMNPAMRFLASTGQKMKPKQGLANQFNKQKQVTSAIQDRVDTPLGKSPAFLLGRGTLMDLLKEMQKKQAGRFAALGMSGSESEIGLANASGQALAGGVRGLLAQGEQGQRSDIQLLLQALQGENSVLNTKLGIDEGKKSRIAQLIGSAFSGASQIAGAAVGKP